MKSFTELIPRRARRDIEEAARANGRTVEEHMAAVAGARPWRRLERPAHRGRVTDVFLALQHAGPEGATDEEIAAHLELALEIVKACRRQLLVDELIEDSTRRLRTTFGLAVVWVLSERGRECLR